uniref:Uncharacterized protein n=1 Tax=Anopheles epiroticus TaxID=199890 RepID=A0A182PKD0_9DIPT
MDNGMMTGKTNSDSAMLGSIGHPHNPLRQHSQPSPATPASLQQQQQSNSQQHLHHHHHHQQQQQQHQQQHHPHHPSDSLTEVSVVDINASLAASAPHISPQVGASVHPTSVPVPSAGVPSFCNILNASNSSDLQAVAYNSLTQNVRCKSPPTLVDNLKNGTIG